MPKYFTDAKLFRGEAGLGAHVIRDIQVGPYRLDLAELRDEAPRADGPAGHFKAFNASLCKACIQDVKAAYLRIGKPRNLRAAGTIFFGAPYNMGTSLPIPPRTQPDAQIWITLEGWDGSMHQASVPWLRHRQPPWPGSKTRRQEMKHLMHALALPWLVLAAGTALAHNPMCECEELASGQVRCTGGFSDGSGAPG